MKLRPARAYLLACMDARLLAEERRLQHLVAERHRIYNDYRREIRESDARLISTAIRPALSSGVSLTFEVDFVPARDTSRFQLLVDTLAREMERMLLGRTLTMGNGSSYGATSVHQDVYRKLLDGMRPHHGFRKLPAARG